MLKARIAVLVSGGGTNLQALIDSQSRGDLKSGEIVLVVSNVQGAYALERAKNAGIESLYLSRKALGGQEAFEEALDRELRSRGVELIILAGFMSILTAGFTKKWPERIINIHPALIPSFCGKGYYGLRVHEAALAYGVKVTGATVHFVNEIPDGGRIISQKAVPVLEGDTPEVLQRRVMEQAEWILLPQAAETVSQKIIKERGKMSDLFSYLSQRPYPGRGIMLGRTPSGRSACVYFIMGRSVNSRNRVFEKTPDGIRTRAFDESKMSDPSLIIYHPVRRYEGKLIVTNGDQTDTIRDFMAQGKCYRHALNTRTFEPDAPNFTPRISGVVKPDGSYNLSILKSLDGDESETCRYFYEYSPAKAGVGHFISTYVGFGDPIPSFRGEPVQVQVPELGAAELAEKVWNALDEANKVSLYVCVGEDEVIINKNKE